MHHSETGAAKLSAVFAQTFQSILNQHGECAIHMQFKKFRGRPNLLPRRRRCTLNSPRSAREAGATSGTFEQALNTEGVPQTWYPGKTRTTGCFTFVEHLRRSKKATLPPRVALASRSDPGLGMFNTFGVKLPQLLPLIKVHPSRLHQPREQIAQLRIAESRQQAFRHEGDGGSFQALHVLGARGVALSGDVAQ